MRLFCFVLLLCLPGISPGAADAPPIPLSLAQAKFRSVLASKFEDLEKRNIGAAALLNGWLFLPAEFRLLSVGQFWGPQAEKVSRSSKPDWADPISAIVDFQKQLKARGIELVLAPVPPKATIYPDKIAPEFSSIAGDVAPYLTRFYEELRIAGVDVLDLTETFKKNRGNERGEVFCKTDSHWSDFGCVLAAQAIAAHVKPKVASQPKSKEYGSEWKEAVIAGDLADLLPAGSEKPAGERIAVRAVNEKGSGNVVEADPKSPILLLGDSHTLVFHEFLGENAGLLDQLALETGLAPDLLGTRGSGATPVRLALYRRSIKDPEYLSKKKVVIWCFSAREFTEATQGWQKLPVAK